MWLIYDQKIVMLMMLLFLGWNSIVDIKCKKISLFSLLALLLATAGLFLGQIGEIDMAHVLGSMALGTLVGFGFCILSFLSGGNIGFGDGIICIALGLYIGIYRTVLSVSWAVFVSFFWAVFLLLVRKRRKSDNFPFVPFIGIGYLITCLMGL